MLAITFESSFGDKFMYQHAMKSPDEMRELHKQFYAYVKRMRHVDVRSKMQCDWREKHEKRRIQKSCRLLNLQKQQEDMKVTMLAYMKCARRIIRIFWRSWRKSRLENC